ncbi:EF-P lysine aminoacylase EpmA [Stieleria varia]|uniref:Elongation factor P--(R)-beta-lysine ligase n=1 Tax=Stieleria varia TaxID=2528005 RepID=A0A5C6B1Q1_9BACT|nr:EF-P lysine aminoacylase EpmA [Stieleria varia]TWU06245.1 Elongation factor P--(R)-beta-lysine ligase [Stieleria varia]
MTPQLQHLQDRAELLRFIRQFFDSRGFLEVQPPSLCRDCVVDPYIDPITVSSGQFGIGHPELAATYYLQTSPESAMKRMLAAGAPSIYSIGPVFRLGERGPRHNLEFTMLEWYEVGGDAASAIGLLGELASESLRTEATETVSYQQAFQRTIDLDPLGATLDEIRNAAETCDHSLVLSLADDRDGLLDLLMSEVVGPTLGWQRPLILTDYPITQAALAKPSADDPRCAARFELFSHGIELANGYDELLDPDVLLQRAEANNQMRCQSGRMSLQTNTTLVKAMRLGLPQCSGVALGVDRLLMIRVGASSIDQVLPFPIEVA